MAEKIVILGSTGSIGTQALQVIAAHADRWQVAGLAAGRNVTLMEEQIRAFHPARVVMYDEDAARDLRDRIKDTDVRVDAGMEGLCALASETCADTVLTSLVGMIGIRPTVAAIEAGHDVALANKETLVAAGSVIMPLVREKQVRLLPMDSEHSAIFQCLNGEQRSQIEEILLTASGGPFRGKKAEKLKDVRKEDALKHPNWSMGQKITIDSATLVNKGLEVIEAMHLFGVSLSQIRVVVQPQSVIHSMVRFADGSVMAQMGTPDMKLPIQYAFSYPARVSLAGERLDFAALRQLTFEDPDISTFRGLPMAYAAAEKGGTAPAVFNAANEAAVGLFLRDRICFLEIYDIIEEAVSLHTVTKTPSLDDIFAAEEVTRAHIAERYGG